MDKVMGLAIDSAANSWVQRCAGPDFLSDPITLCQHGAESPTLVVYNGIRRAFFTSWVATLATGILSAMQQCPDG
jgi:hypothetical protein